MDEELRSILLGTAGFGSGPGKGLRESLNENTLYLHDAKLAQNVARDLLAEGIYVIAFSFPVVPKGEARIRVQVSAAHTHEHLNRAVAACATVGRRQGVV